MTFKFIDRLGIGINSLDLEILEFNSDPYSTLLYQHRGDFQPTPQKFGSSNQTETHSRFIEFVRLAKADNVSLALTPEYSCPWTVISEILTDDSLHPSNRKLFALGCESIQRNELERLKEDFSSAEIEIYFDVTVLDANGNFFDPLCYFFKNQNKLYLIVQFKTHHMGVWTDPIEQNNYKSGREIYILRNDVNSIYLFTLICSEAMNFTVDQAFLNAVDNRWQGNSYIILNPQLNPKPNSQEFKRFRELVLNYNNKDLICLNWEKGTTINGTSFIGFNRSAFHLKSHQINFDSDNKFISNHLLGMYYLYNGRDNHSFYLSSLKSMFKIRCNKPITDGGVGVQIRKTEPEVQNVYFWQNSSYTSINNIDDGLIHFLDEYRCTSAYLRRMDICCIDKERLINLSCAQIKISDGLQWQLVNNLFSYQMDDTWVINRLTFLEDTEGLEQRKKYIQAIEILNKVIIQDEDLWPPSLASLKNKNVDEVKFLDGNVPGKYLYNFFGTEGKATVAYIGLATINHAVKNLDEMKNIFQDHSKNRIVVWFKTSPINNEFDFAYNEIESHITDLQVYNTKSINK